MRYTTLDPVRLPPLLPWVVGGKIAISCHKEREFLIRAWTTSRTNPTKLFNWILHYVGRLDLSELEWFGYTYSGQPNYMQLDRTNIYTSGLTIQYFVEPKDNFMKRLLDEGKIGLDYGTPSNLLIPDKGYVQKVHDG